MYRLWFGYRRSLPCAKNRERVCSIASEVTKCRPPAWVALNNHPLSRRLKAPTSYRQATELSSQPQAIICRNKTF
ncbi:hypothetical protein DHU27_19545 [Salmonella enterica]|nr:hypothetical protein [Salmonella enterica]